MKGRTSKMANNQNQGRGGSNQGSSKQSTGSSSRSGGSDNERGFAAMSDGEQREAARKGGEAVSQDRQHMADIGRKGGSASAESRSGSSNSRSASGSSRSDGSDTETRCGRAFWTVFSTSWRTRL